MVAVYVPIHHMDGLHMNKLAIVTAAAALLIVMPLTAEAADRGFGAGGESARQGEARDASKASRDRARGDQVRQDIEEYGWFAAGQRLRERQEQRARQRASSKYDADFREDR